MHDILHHQNTLINEAHVCDCVMQWCLNAISGGTVPFTAVQCVNVYPASRQVWQKSTFCVNLSFHSYPALIFIHLNQTGQSKHPTANLRMVKTSPPPPVQATVNDHKLMEPTPCWDKGVAYVLHCAWYMQKDMLYYSENQGAKYATKAIMPQSASLAQNMNIMHLKTQVSDSTHSTQ